MVFVQHNHLFKGYFRSLKSMIDGERIMQQFLQKGTKPKWKFHLVNWEAVHKTKEITWINEQGCCHQMAIEDLNSGETESLLRKVIRHKYGWQKKHPTTTCSSKVGRCILSTHEVGSDSFYLLKRKHLPAALHLFFICSRNIFKWLFFKCKLIINDTGSFFASLFFFFLFVRMSTKLSSSLFYSWGISTKVKCTSP